jgi:hypothetical protein
MNTYQQNGSRNTYNGNGGGNNANGNAHTSGSNATQLNNNRGLSCGHSQGRGNGRNLNFQGRGGGCGGARHHHTHIAKEPSPKEDIAWFAEEVLVSNFATEKQKQECTMDSMLHCTLDLGASCHFCPEQDQFSNFVETPTRQVQTSDRHTFDAGGYRKIAVYLLNRKDANGKDKHTCVVLKRQGVTKVL